MWEHMIERRTGMGGQHWLPDEIRKFNEAAKISQGDVKAFIYEMRKAGTQRTLAQIYSRCNKGDTRPPFGDLLMKKLSKKVRYPNGTIRPSAMRPLRALDVNQAVDDVATEEVTDVTEEASQETSGAVTSTQVAPAGDGVVLKHIAYCVLGEQLGRVTKQKAYDDIVDVLKQRGIVR
jgi:hypothetical protein